MLQEGQQGVAHALHWIILKEQRPKPSHSASSIEETSRCALTLPRVEKLSWNRNDRISTRSIPLDCKTRQEDRDPHLKRATGARERLWEQTPVWSIICYHFRTRWIHKHGYATWRILKICVWQLQLSANTDSYFSASPTRSAVFL